MKRYETLSVFPEFFDTYLSSSIMGRAQDKGLFEFEAYNLRDWTHDKHNTVDDCPFGGGQGMLMKPDPFYEAYDSISALGDIKPYVVFFAPAGTPYNQRVAERLSKQDRILFVCGRYEGIDQRAFELADETISLGDYVLTGGELPAMVVIDSLVRLIPGALGDTMSAVDESFSTEGLIEYEQYTRPSSYRGMDVPEVLLSGHHGKIAEWRRMNAIERTARLRPDMIETADLSEEERIFANNIVQSQINNDK